MANHRDRIDQRLGDYELTHFLGQGSFGDVYLGIHVRDQSQAAVKVLHTQLNGSGEIHQFINEARTIRLRHPNILRLLDFDITENNVPFLVMDYAPHGTLRTRHPGSMPLPFSLIVTYVRQMASALQYAHDQGIIHRDVKPENMLFGASNKVQLSDFGIAAIAHRTASQHTQGSAGTPLYMAPEQLKGKPLPASDQYAMGIILYEWLSGTHPFHGNLWAIQYQHVHVPPPSLRERIPTIAPEIEQVVLKALAKNPAERFVNVQALATAFEQASQTVLLNTAEPTTATDLLEQSKPTFLVSTPPDKMVSTAHAPQFDIPPIQPIQADSSLQPTFAPAINTLSSSTALTATSSASTPTPVHTHIVSRRKIALGLGLTGLATLGGITWLTVSHQLLFSTHKTTTPRTTKPSTPATSTSGVQPEGTLIYTYTAHSYGVTGVAWSPNGIHIASASYDQSLRIWDAASGNTSLVYTYPTDYVYAVAWSPNGSRVVSGNGNINSRQNSLLYINDAIRQQPLFTCHGHTDWILAVDWSSDSSSIVSGSQDHTVRTWNAENGKLLHTLQGHTDVVNDVAWSPNGQSIASASNDRTARIWDASGNIERIYREHSDSVIAVAWSPNGQRIASASNDKTVHIWDAATGAHLLTCAGHTDAVWTVAWSHDGNYIASGGKDQTVRIWRADTATLLYTYTHHTDHVLTVAWSPDSIHIASGGDDHDHTVQVWVGA